MRMVILAVHLALTKTVLGLIFNSALGVNARDRAMMGGGHNVCFEIVTNSWVDRLPAVNFRCVARRHWKPPASSRHLATMLQLLELSMFFGRRRRA